MYASIDWGKVCNRYCDGTLLFEVTKDGLVLRELAHGYTVEDIRECTEADFTVAEHVAVMDV